MLPYRLGDIAIHPGFQTLLAISFHRTGGHGDYRSTKLRKMFERQLRHLPPPPWDSEAWTPAACTRGRLFYRYGSAVPRTAGVHPDHLQGHWIERERLGELPAASDSVWQVVPRNDWMCPRPPVAHEGRDLAALARLIDEGATGLATLVRRGDVADSPPVFVVSAAGGR